MSMDLYLQEEFYSVTKKTKSVIFIELPLFAEAKCSSVIANLLIGWCSILLRINCPFIVVRFTLTEKKKLLTLNTELTQPAGAILSPVNFYYITYYISDLSWMLLENLEFKQNF